MDPRYRLSDPTAVASPALLFYRDLIAANVDRMLALAGSPQRLRPHAKTHKTRAIIEMLLQRGVTKHKCATLAEADLLAQAGAPDVLIAYQMVGPNCERLAKLAQLQPATRFSVLVDHADAIPPLVAALARAGQSVDVLIDVDCGQHRTGILPDERAIALYEQITRQKHLRPGGIHAYDGQNNQAPLAERQAAVKHELEPVLRLRDQMHKRSLPVPRFVVGGTPTFPVHVASDLPELECSPGTCVLYDCGYGAKFPDLGLTPAATLLTRVVSRPMANRVTFDLGTKAVASDPPAGQRLLMLDLADAKAVMHNEEHLVLETPQAERFRLGDVGYAIPAHVCPTVALHRSALVVEGGKIVDEWPISARDRTLRI